MENNNFKYRIQFKKFDKMRFIGHLDLVHIFQRGIKRAGLPIAYSQGFNPHQQTSFALPLGLGMAGYKEYLEIELVEQVEPELIKTKLNHVLPDGTEIVFVRALLKDEKGAGSLLEAAEYTSSFQEGAVSDEQLEAMLNEIMEEKEIHLEKKTKNGCKVVDIRADIFKLALNKIKDGDVKSIEMIISAGSVRSLKPQLVMEYIFGRMNLAYDIYKIKYARVDLFLIKDGEFISLC